MPRLVVDPAFVVGAVDRRLFGSFVEHMGRCVYTGIYEPGHPAADPDGFRSDVLELVRELGVTAVRYPGGNFVSNYDWEDGVGPKDQRPRKLDLAWRAIEPNQFGTDEFVAWAGKAGVEPVWAVNLGTRGIKEAVELLSYTNLPAGTELPDRRVANGHEAPYGIKVWCLGNEMDGPWQIGHKTAEEYARLAEETANAMRRVDLDLELVACGSSNSGMATFGEWERVVLERTYELVDHISLHAYYEPRDDSASFLAAAEDMERMISSVIATADHVKALKRSSKEITLSFDEWNVWRQSDFPGELGLGIREVSPLIEDTYTVDDAVVVGSLLITLLRHADRVKIACLAQLVNVIGPIRTEPGGRAWRQTIFHPFALTAKYAGPTVLQTAISDGPEIDTASFGRVPALWSTATYDEKTGEIAIFVVNRSETDKIDLQIPVGGLRLARHLALYDDDRAAVNTADDPDRVVPRVIEGTEIVDGVCTATLPPASWHLIQLTV
ncbi:alpha-N-arabinofuranosidase [Kribbella albertanoniae]|uniref:non-reducing end alpha-L-arabinofuranosidase n=1 Tax=Kribbella albertanoniae TaxID=1266829 RepID=A0A4R4Q3F1_9ACTN|nr:alpha-N-arabinofuranosidase [Kribbella albertanoniae]TDC29601.1 alpha-N-arabinofuranosidase [Kribbella albertanoniae]